MDRTARDVYAQRQLLQLALCRILFSLWSWVTEACLTACLLEMPASASEPLIAMQGNIHQSLLPHFSSFHFIFLLCFRIQMFMYFKWLFFPPKMLSSQIMISVFSISIHFDHILWQVTWVTGLGLPEDISKLHFSAHGLFYTKKKCFRKEWQIMSAASLGCEGQGRSRLDPGYQGLGPLQLSPVMRHVHMCWHRWARTWRCTAFCYSSWESGT